MADLSRLSVLIPTKDEEKNLPECLESVRGAGEVFVVDSHSTDRTCEIAESLGAKVFRHKFEDYSKQKNWAFDNLPWSNDWIFIIDADERMTPELAAEIGETVSRGPDEACFLVRRRFVWMGRWLRHGGCFPDWQQRLVRRGRARYEDRSVNERLVVDGKIGKLKGCLIHEDRKGLSAWLEKHNRYSTMEALESLREGRDGQVRPRLFTRDPIARKRFIQRRVWPWVPFKPTAFFLYQYILRLGFLDGAAGYRYARLKSRYIYWTELKKRELLAARAAQGTGKKT